MTDLTAETAPTIADVARLYTMQEELGKLKAAEAMLRSRIAKHFFPDPTEGSADNKMPLNDGTGAVLQMDHKINRKVLEPELAALKEAAKQEGSNAPKIPWNKVLKTKVELSVSEYKKLTVEERQYVDQALEVKPGMPELKVVIPKRA